VINKLFNKLFGKIKTSDEIFNEVISREVFYIPRIIHKDEIGNTVIFENIQKNMVGIIPVFSSLESLKKEFPDVEYEKLTWKKL